MRRWLKLKAKVDWNDKQIEAIDSRNGSVLVSAAAGSGKSAVLVERVIRRLCDEENKCPADSLMIVTFTNAAASGLRHKINEALSEKIRENPNNEYLARQQRLLSSTVIGTMDAFCGNLVRENFFRTDIETDFRILDSAEETLLESNAIDTVLEKYYAEKSKGFVDLLELFGSDKYDRSMIENIKKCYEYAVAYPFPKKWIDTLLNEYDPDTPVYMTESGKAILNDIRLKLDLCIKNLNYAIDYCEGIEKLENGYIPDLTQILEYCKGLYELVENNEWDALKQKLDAGYTFATAATIRGEEGSYPEKINAKRLRDSVKGIIGSLYKEIPLDEAQYRSDCIYLKDALECYANIVKDFIDELLRLKKEENAYSFSDISHFALELLVDENGDKTPLARELSSKFTEILIDEYQDTNRAQELLFTAISKDEKNLFVVGDVKQSIYRFRKAMPEIFIERRDGYDYYDKDRDNYPSKIILDSNYRSRKSIIDTVNFVFSRIMNAKTGDIVYNEDEALNFHSKYEGEDYPCEIHYLVKEGKNILSEGEHIANQIEELISSRMQVKDGDNYRDITYSDICILVRKMKDRQIGILNDVKKRNIPIVCEASESFCNLYEVSVILSLLKAVDNPLNDMALLTTLFSPVFGFTPDELALIRLEDKDGRFYTCLKKYALHNEKAKAFLETLSDFKKYSVVYSTPEMLRRIYEQTGFDETVRAMTNGEKRSANLMHLLDYAESFESKGFFGLSEFVRFVDRVTRSGGDIGVDSTMGMSGDCVRMMTIHKSKGLEFPVVFIAACNDDKREDHRKQSEVKLNMKTKLGVKRQDREKLIRIPTVQYDGTNIRNDYDDISEELRILYVAMTRARERLYFVITSSGLSISAPLDSVVADGKIHPYSVVERQNYAKWLLSIAFTASGCKALRDMGNFCCDRFVVRNTDFLSFKVFRPSAVEEEVDEKSRDAVEIDNEFARQLEERINYVYPYKKLACIAAKRTASGFNEQEINDEFFAAEKPAFMGKGSFTPAQRGTFTHLFMEKCEFDEATKDVAKELERLTDNGVFTPEQAQAVNVKNLEKFFESELYERIKNSSEVGREKQFTVEIPAEFFENGITNDENVVVQGKIDCFFIEDGEAVIIDYKTDYVKDEKELTDRYNTQMKIYKNAVEQFTGKNVKEVLLYSFCLDKTVKCL